MRSWSEFYALDPQPLGRGGQAEVMRGRDRQTGEYVAIKRVLSKDEESLARMRREVDVQRRLNHACVMPVLRHSATYSWYSMPLARRSLSSIAPPIDDELIATVVGAALDALEAAHPRGIIHRDITPTNILDIGKDTAHWVLADWGMVRVHGRTTVMRTRPGEFGTAGYAAPETWIDAHAVDHRADIYSLGRVVSWCTSGVTPVPNMPLIPDGTWQRLVASTTALRVEDRSQTLADVRHLFLEAVSRPASEHPNKPGIPQEVISLIRAQAAREFPDDYSTQKFVIEREIGAYHGIQRFGPDDVPTPILGRLAQKVQEEFPDDFSTRLFVLNREVDAWRQLQEFSDEEVPSKVLERILDRASLQFPDDFSTRLFVVKREIEAWKSLNR